MKKNIYEGMYILRPTLSDDAREKALNKITSIISSLGGSIEKIIDWGRRKLAYEIKDCMEGNYYLIYFTLPTNAIGELITENHLHEDLLRFMNTSIDKVPEHNEIRFKQIAQMCEE